MAGNEHGRPHDWLLRRVPEKYPGRGIPFCDDQAYHPGMMNIRAGKETLSFLAMAAFFGGGLLLTEEFIPVSNTWDYIVLHVLTMMNGLGLCVVLALWVVRICDRKTEAQENSREKARAEMGE